MENQENFAIPRISFHFFWFSKNFLEKQEILPMKDCVIFKENIYHFNSYIEIELNREEHEKDISMKWKEVVYKYVQTASNEVLILENTLTFFLKCFLHKL